MAESTLPRSRLRLVGETAGVAVAGFVFGIVLLLAVSLALGLLAVQLVTTQAVVLGLVALQGVAFPVVGLSYLRYRGLGLDFLNVETPDFRDVLAVVGGYVTAFGLAIAMLVLVSLLEAPTAERADQEVLQQPEVLLLLVPLSFLLIGPGEELLFRGVIQGTLRQRFGPVAAILLASAMFAPAHVLALVGSPAALLVSIGILFVPSLVLGAVYELTDNLVVPALVHGAYNATIFGLAYVGTTLDGTAGLL